MTSSDSEANTVDLFAKLPEVVLYDPRLTPNTKLVYAAISNLARQKGYSFIANQNLADRLSISVSTLKDALRCLGHLRLLDVQDVRLVAHRVPLPVDAVYDWEYRLALRAIQRGGHRAEDEAARGDGRAYRERLKAEHARGCPVLQGRAASKATAQHAGVPDLPAARRRRTPRPATRRGSA